MTESSSRTLRLLHMGRSSIDLYSNDVGAPFVDITSFAAHVGGSPTNISVGAARLGLRTALLTGFGVDPVGDFIEHFLQQEGVDTRFSVRKQGHRTSAVILGIEPPDKFPLVYYRDNCATSSDHRRRWRRWWPTARYSSLRAPISARIPAAARPCSPRNWPSRWARRWCWTSTSARPVARPARLRRHHPRRAPPGRHRHRHRGRDQRVHAHRPQPDEPDPLPGVGHQGDGRHGVTHRVSWPWDRRRWWRRWAAEGARIHLAGGEVIDATGYPVEIYKHPGRAMRSARAFYGYVNGWGWRKSARLGNACGAIVVTKHGCANFTPTYDEVMAFVGERGDLIEVRL
ncbi:MAG: PfkB family carbohydrate kinase [Caldilineaceae bacterium]